MVKKTTKPVEPTKPVKRTRAAAKPAAVKETAPVKPASSLSGVAKKAAAIGKAQKLSVANSKNPAKKSADKGKRAGNTTERLPTNTDESEESSRAKLDASKLPSKYQLFIEEFLVDQNATQASIRCGYSVANARDTGHRLRHHPDIEPIIDALLAEKIERIRMSRERVLDEIESMASADSNELSEHRRVPCRYCHSFDGEYQYTPAEYKEAKERWDERQKMANLMRGKKKGGVMFDESELPQFKPPPVTWYDKRLQINPECPECHGDGVGEVILKDTRNLSRRGRSIYAGTKIGKDGIEVKTYSKEVAVQTMAKHHKIFEEQTTINVNNFDAATLEERFGSKMKTSHERMKAMREERGLPPKSK